MKLFSTLAAFALFTSLSAQVFNSPESVEYDAVGNRWFTSQHGSGDIFVYSPGSSTIIPFATGCTSPNGIEILGSVLYACDGGRIKGFDLTTGAQVFNLNLSATFLNGLTTDGSTYLFATDFSAKKIYRICPATSTFNVMCTTVKTPNGIIYDGANNRCVFVTWGSNAPIQAMSLGDSTVTTLLTTTLGNCDGITQDAAGYWYVTAWTGNKLCRVDPTFSTAPVSVMTGLSSPADIDINSANDSIGIPNSGTTNNVVYYTLPTSVQAENTPEEGSLFPVPAAESFKFVIKTPVQNGVAEIYDMTGKLVRREEFSGTTKEVGRENIPYGPYMVIIREGENKFFEGKIIFAPAE
jgi:sugar lactone lactonase YvrE